MKKFKIPVTGIHKKVFQKGYVQNINVFPKLLSLQKSDKYSMNPLPRLSASEQNTDQY